MPHVAVGSQYQARSEFLSVALHDGKHIALVQPKSRVDSLNVQRTKHSVGGGSVESTRRC